MLSVLDMKLKIVLMFCFFLFGVSAYGPSTPYWEDNPLFLNPGEEVYFNITLQNLAGEEDVTLKARVDENSIADLVMGNPSEYLVLFGRDDIHVPIRVSVPRNAEIGEKFDIAVSFREVRPGDSGVVSVALENVVTFPVIVGRVVSLSPEETTAEDLGKGISLGMIIFVSSLAFVSLVLIVYLFVRLRRTS